MKSLPPQWRAHGNREPVSPGRTSSPPALRRGWRPLVAAAFTAGLLALTATAAFAQGVWQTLPSTPTAHSSPAGVTAPCPHARHRTCVYVVAGDNLAGELSTVEAYSPATNTWATLPSLPTARGGLAGAAAPCPGALHRTCVYAIGGFSTAGTVNTVEAYSPATNTWATLPSLPTARSELAGTTAPCPRGHAGLAGTCVYAIGGGGSPGAGSAVTAYSPATNTWATLPSMPTARGALAAATAPCPGARHRTCVYAFGGLNGSALNTVQAYSPATNTWATLPSLPTARWGLAGATAPCPATRHRTCVYAMGGSINNITGMNTVEAYSPATNTWATLPSLPTARYDLVGATAPCPVGSHRTCVYALNGFNGTNPVNTVEAFDVGR
jgi:hypothetical protein